MKLIKGLGKEARLIIPALVYTIIFYILAHITLRIDHNIAEYILIGTILDTVLIVTYILSIYYLFNSSAEIALNSRKMTPLSFVWFVVSSVLILIMAGGAFIGALGALNIGETEEASAYSIIIGWIVGTHILRIASPRIFDIMVGMAAWLIIFALFFSATADIVPSLGMGMEHFLLAIGIFAGTYIVVKRRLIIT